MLKPIIISDLSLSLAHNNGFKGFSYQIAFGERIGLIGQNGCGKSTLLKILIGQFSRYDGHIHIPKEYRIAYVPQILEPISTLSMGQQLIEQIKNAVATLPDLLLLDEPTNHLDKANRQHLIKLLSHYHGTLIVISHDITFIEKTVTTLWHIYQNKLIVFQGHYRDYLAENERQKLKLHQQLHALHKEKQQIHDALMRQQKRNAQSQAQGKKNLKKSKWAPVVGHAKKQYAQKSQGKKIADIQNKRQESLQALNELYIPDDRIATFNITAQHSANNVLFSVSNGGVGYHPPDLILDKLYLSLHYGERIAITGSNGRGKSTFFKAIIGEPELFTTGEWLLPKRSEIGYLDQSYRSVNGDLTVIEAISGHAPNWSYQQKRHYLNQFLFCSNDEVNNQLRYLSGGEKVRLSLAQLSAHSPKMLILDEITNNLDIQTVHHIINVLNQYNGALMITSHDEWFLQQIGIDKIVEL